MLTQLGDLVIDNEVLSSYISENLDKTNRLINSGAVVRSAVLDGFLANGGENFVIPSFEALDKAGVFDNGTDDTTVITDRKLGTGKQIATRIHQNASWATSNLASIVSGNGETGWLTHVSNQIINTVNSNIQAHLIAILEGLFGGALTASENDQSGSSYDSNMLIDTLAAFEDVDPNGECILLARPEIFRSMQKEGLVETVQLQDQTAKVTRYMDTYNVIVDSSLPTSGGVHTSYIVKPDAVLYGRDAGVETTHVEEFFFEGMGSGTTKFLQRIAYSLHPEGVAYVGGIQPAIADLQNPGNWSSVYDLKHIGLASLKSLA